MLKRFSHRRETKKQKSKQIADSIELKTQVAAGEEEAARIIAQANEEAKEIKRKAETTADNGTVSDMAIGEKIEESAQPQDEVTVSEPGESTKDYSGEIELVIAGPVDLKMVSRLFDSLQTTPELRILRISGSVIRGATITVVLERPIPLIRMISSKMPELEATLELPQKNSLAMGKSISQLGEEKKGVSRIKLALKDGDTSSRG